jgi:hypothetical protein
MRFDISFDSRYTFIYFFTSSCFFGEMVLYSIEYTLTDHSRSLYKCTFFVNVRFP